MVTLRVVDRVLTSPRPWCLCDGQCSRHSRVSHRFNILICSVSRALCVVFLSRLRGRDHVNFGVVDADLTNNHR